MALLDIVIVPDQRLKTRCEPVGEITAAIRKLAQDMLETMYDAPGIGLAAPQVGVLKRLVVLDVADEEAPRKPLVMINPEITWKSEESRTYQEGCLSIPEIYGDVTRPEKIKVRYTDLENQTHEIEADGLLSTCIQHEIDHIDGVLFIDHMSSLKRSMILRKMTKLKRDNTRPGKQAAGKQAG
jgi:peptide deformylase